MSNVLKTRYVYYTRSNHTISHKKAKSVHQLGLRCSELLVPEGWIAGVGESSQKEKATELGFLALAFVAGLNVDKFIAKIEGIAQAA